MFQFRILEVGTPTLFIACRLTVIAHPVIDLRIDHRQVRPEAGNQFFEFQILLGHMV